MKNYIKINELKNNLQKNEAKIRYYTTHKYNTTIILERFLELLEKDGYNVEINSKYREKLQLNIRQSNFNEDKIIYKNYITYILSDLGDVYIEFKINDYIYYLQLDDNWLFEDSSYMTCNKIYYDTYNRPYTKRGYAGGENIYHCFNTDIFNIECDHDKNAEQLYKYFKEKVFEKESPIYYPHPRKEPGVAIKDYLEK